MFGNKMRPVHPGEILREDFLEPLGMSAHALAAVKIVDDRGIESLKVMTLE